jgi:hypothetical protein
MVSSGKAAGEDHLIDLTAERNRDLAPDAFPGDATELGTHADGPGRNLHARWPS